MTRRVDYRMPRFALALSALGGLLAVGCSATPTPRRDAAVDAARDALLPDARPSCRPELLGRPCRQQNECGEQGACLRDLDAEVGVCVCSCTPDNPRTPISEDDCPRPGLYVCGTVLDTGGAGASARSFCFQRCSPELGSNECQGELACLPESTQITGSSQAVCASVGCSGDWDCPVRTSRACDPAGEQGDPCPADQRCRANADGAGAGGLCVLPGRCDRRSGLCGPRADEATFEATAAVGDPCADDTQCGPQMVCLRQIDDAATLGAEGAACETDDQCCSGECTVDETCAAGACETRFRNGYCTIRGCGFDKLTPFSCPEGSSCNRFYAPALCQRECLPGDASGCRGEAAIDKRGDYECRAWNQVTIGDRPFADGPVCDFGHAVPCDLFSVEGLTCAVFGVTGNTTEMSCRALDGTARDERDDPSGYCLDNTVSGGPR
jgi:hypothetical protein